MSNVNLAARVSPREFAIVAYQAGMQDASVAEIAKYALRRLAGDAHEIAKAKALSLRGSHTVNTADKIVGIRVPVEWIEEARQNSPGNSQNLSFLLRYSLMRISSPEDEAIELASRKMGPRKN